MVYRKDLNSLGERFRLLVNHVGWFCFGVISNFSVCEGFQRYDGRGGGGFIGGAVLRFRVRVIKDGFCMI